MCTFSCTFLAIADANGSLRAFGRCATAAELEMTPECQANIFRSVKTRIQLDPVTYNNGLIGGFRKVIANEGAGAVWTGFGPTAAGYFLQGAFKFGGYELFKQQAINLVGYETASNNRTAVYLASAACAEFFADIALCPLEATRIRLVSEPTFANGLIGGFGKILKTEGVGAFYSGFGPILFKQYVAMFFAHSFIPC
jgi:solute carrier family 25 phosphate transporter 3